MNRLERIQLMERADKAEAKSADAVAQLAALRETVEAMEQRIVSLENKPKLGRPPKATDGNGQERPTA